MCLTSPEPIRASSGVSMPTHIFFFSLHHASSQIFQRSWHDDMNVLQLSIHPCVLNSGCSRFLVLLFSFLQVYSLGQKLMATVQICKCGIIQHLSSVSMIVCIMYVLPWFTTAFVNCGCMLGTLAARDILLH